MARRKSHLVPMRHKDVSQPYNAPPGAVRFWEAQGWEVVGERPASVPPAEAAPVEPAAEAAPARTAAAKKKEA